MQDIINIIAISDKGKSRIGKKLTMAIVEQNHHDKMFIVIPGTNQCRWIKKDNDPDFRIIEEDWWLLRLLKTIPLPLPLLCLFTTLLLSYELSLTS